MTKVFLYVYHLHIRGSILFGLDEDPHGDRCCCDPPIFVENVPHALLSSASRPMSVDETGIHYMHRVSHHLNSDLLGLRAGDVLSLLPSLSSQSSAIIFEQHQYTLPHLPQTNQQPTTSSASPVSHKPSKSPQAKPSQQ